MDNASQHISAVVHTLTAAETLERLLASIRWVNELIVVDMRSDDETRAIAERFGARIFTIEPHPRVDAIRNAYLEKAAGPWILVMDADEYLSDDGEEQIRSLLAEHGEQYDAFSIPRYNQIGSHIMRGSDWWPDPQIRLFRKGCVHWPDATHVPPAVTTGAERLLMLDAPCLHIHHTNYKSLAEFMTRQMRYAINDVYSDDAKAFHFSDYVAAAYRVYACRHDTESDGALSHALATVLAWDQIVRGLIHWEKLGCPGNLEEAFSLPTATERFPDEVRNDLENQRRLIQQLQHELQALKRSRTVRFNQWLSRTVLEPIRKRFFH